MTLSSAISPLVDLPDFLRVHGGGRKILLALSGGPDSVALLLTAAHFRDTLALEAAIVDHGLRAESAQESVQARSWAEAQGVPAQVLVWEGGKPSSRLQERARNARYALLQAHAERCGADWILTGHHADDQWETVCFRLARGSGVAGLAGMTAVQAQAGVGAKLGRPLLALPKQRLIEFCIAHGHPYITDPSNQNPIFARARLRALAPALAAEGFDALVAQRLAMRARKADEAIDYTADCLERATQRDGFFDLASIEVGMPLAGLERFLARRILAMRASSPIVETPLRLERLETLARHIDQARRSKKAFRGVLGGVIVSLTQKGRLSFAKELRRKELPERAKVVSNSIEV